MSLKGPTDIFKMNWIPQKFMWTNYIDVFRRLPFDRYFLNTIKITLIGVIGGTISASAVAFGFSRLRFPGRDTLFLLVLATMMVPFPVTMIPTFVLFKWLGWINTFKPLIVPAFFGGGPFFIFLLRQFYMSIPTELDEAAKIDGCGYFRLYWRIALPLAKPGLVAVAIYIFQNKWNDLMAPLIYLNSEHLRTVALGLSLLTIQSEEPMLYVNLMMAASFIFLLPPLLIFFLLQKNFIQGVVISGVKG